MKTNQITEKELLEKAREIMGASEYENDDFEYFDDFDDCFEEDEFIDIYKIMGIKE